MSNFPIRETSLYTDDAKLIADMLREEWSIDSAEIPNIEYEPEQFMVNARNGNIYVYLVSRNNSIATTDYRTLTRESRIGIRVSNRFRGDHFIWCDEVYRILMSNRRHGKANLGGYGWLEVTGDRTFNDLSGWYTTTFDIKLVSYHTPLRTAGFGDDINKQIGDNTQ